ncbi:MAG TPA: hypothetical protein VHP38_04330 [Ruminiclostridium sp.]|nr:hypothetical protein [Ruminiclostridium sp.]
MESRVDPGKRDFVWSIDSVDYGDLPGSIELKSIWGSAPDDIWGACYSADVRDCLWHYDGKVWKRATGNSPLTSYGKGSREVGNLWGTAKNDVWAIGGRLYSSGQDPDPYVMHFDGNKWSEVPMVSTMPLGSSDILGIDKDDFWVASAGMITHYYHREWIRYPVGGSMTEISKLGLIEGMVYATSYQIGSNTIFLSKFANNRFATVDSTDAFSGIFGHSGLIQSGNKVYSPGICRIASADIKSGGIDVITWKKEIELSTSFANSFFCSQNNIWAYGYPSNLYHFNGINWKEVKISGTSKPVAYDGGFYGLWTDGKEIIVCDCFNGVVYHGR